MNKLDGHIEKLLIFMKNEIEDNAHHLKAVIFNFSSDADTKDGADLIELKKIINIRDNEVFKQIFSKAINEGYIEEAYSSDKRNEFIKLRENGLRMANAIELNQKSVPKKAIKNIADKLIYPVIVVVISTFMMSYFQDKKLETMSKEIEQLKKDVRWMKQKK